MLFGSVQSAMLFMVPSMCGGISSKKNVDVSWSSLNSAVCLAKLMK